MISNCGLQFHSQVANNLENKSTECIDFDPAIISYYKNVHITLGDVEEVFRFINSYI